MTPVLPKGSAPPRCVPARLACGSKTGQTSANANSRDLDKRPSTADLTISLRSCDIVLNSFRKRDKRLDVGSFRIIRIPPHLSSLIFEILRISLSYKIDVWSDRQGKRFEISNLKL